MVSRLARALILLHRGISLWAVLVPGSWLCSYLCLSKALPHFESFVSNDMEFNKPRGLKKKKRTVAVTCLFCFAFYALGTGFDSMLLFACTFLFKNYALNKICET